MVRWLVASLFLLIVLQTRAEYGITDGSEKAPQIWLLTDTIAPATAGQLLHGFDSRSRILFDYPAQTDGMYSYYLEGWSSNWTPWLPISSREYFRLPSGKYVLNARLKSPDGSIITFDPVSFRIRPPWYLGFTAFFLYSLLALSLFSYLYQQLKYSYAQNRHMLEGIINLRTEELIKEKEESEKLLANVLPKNTADELLMKGKAAKTKYNFVTVLFSDIEGFTRIAEEMNPEILIDELDKFFFHFDSVVERYRIEKIKTIGDAYMCAGGIPEKNRTNPVEVVLAALEMQKYMRIVKEDAEKEGRKFWDIRIGIHTGTVVAGVVGQKKLSFDIWGDTVNTASRMESSGEPGKVNISGTTWEFVKDYFNCTHRGRMPVKYKGEIDMYFVDEIKPELSDDGVTPNERFNDMIHILKLQDVEDYVARLFDEEASPDLYFHNAALFRSICSQSDLLSNAHSLTPKDQKILKMASIFLISGYLLLYDQPVEAGYSLAEEVLTKYGFDEELIEGTKKTIFNVLNSNPGNLLEEILWDSMNAHYGRVDFVILTEKLLKELVEHGKIQNPETWFADQQKILQGFSFKTSTAKMLANISPAEQLKRLSDLIGSGR